MDKLEEKLKRLALRGPSTRLEERMEELFASPQTRTPRPFALPRTISLRWGLTCAGLVGLICFLAGAYTSPPWLHGRMRQIPIEAAASQEPAVVVTVQYKPNGKNPFDWTRAADDGLRPGQSITISYPKESRS